MGKGQASVGGRVADVDSLPCPHPLLRQAVAPSGTQRKNVSVISCSCQQKSFLHKKLG